MAGASALVITQDSDVDDVCLWLGALQIPEVYYDAVRCNNMNGKYLLTTSNSDFLNKLKVVSVTHRLILKKVHSVYLY